jgi:hypothetical protein
MAAMTTMLLLGLAAAGGFAAAKATGAKTPAPTDAGTQLGNTATSSTIQQPPAPPDANKASSAAAATATGAADRTRRRAAAGGAGRVMLPGGGGGQSTIRPQVQPKTLLGY